MIESSHWELLVGRLSGVILILSFNAAVTNPRTTDRYWSIRVEARV